MSTQKFIPLFSFLLLILLSLPLAAQQALSSNTGAREKDPVMSADGNRLYFTRPDFPSNQGNDKTADIWVRQRDANGDWGRALNPGSPINSFGNDRPLGLSADGNRIAVLRTGATSFIDLLERSGRNWRVIDSWSLPNDVVDPEDLTFNANAQRLIYSSRSSSSTLDLYSRLALPSGNWSAPQPLSLLNEAGNERRPALASDGRTLYFRRDGGKWFRQVDRGLPAEEVAIPPRYLQFATNGYRTVAMTDDLGKDEKIYPVDLPAQFLPPSFKLVKGNLAVPAAPGEQTVAIPLSSGRSLYTRPDALQRFAVSLRENESPFPGSSLPQLPQGAVTGSLASTAAAAGTGDRERYIRESLSVRQRELARLDRLRQQSYTGAIPADDPEHAALRARLVQTNEMNGDTLPPANTRRANGTRARYADDLSELERMKEKFRRQQEEKLMQREDGRTSSPAWSPSAVDTLRTPRQLPNSMYARSPYYRPDTSALRSNVQSGLYPDRRPAPYEREPWENSVRQTLPRRESLSPEEMARLDSEYEQRMREVEALRAQLRELEDENYRRQPQNDYRQPAQDPSYPPPTGRRQWTTKSAEPINRSPQPATYSRTPYPAAPSPSPIESRGSTTPAPEGVSFIPNTAYPNSAGYDALDQLGNLVRSVGSVVEIRVHTSIDLDRRSAQLLSEERAVTIRNHLLELGIAAANFTVIGYGNHQTGGGGERVEVFY